MHIPFLTTLILFPYAIESLKLPPIHFPITRRDGCFPSPDTANLSQLTEILSLTVSRFQTTTRILSHNRVVRIPSRHFLSPPSKNENANASELLQPGTALQPGATLLGEVGLPGHWFATLNIGTPIQMLDLDLDMLSGDFVIVSTPSGTGSFYLEGLSSTYNDDGEVPVFPTCKRPRDIINMKGVNGEDRGIPVRFGLCKPAKAWVGALGKSGGLVGLAIGEGLKQVRVEGLLGQLVEGNLISEEVWSVMLLNGMEGVWSVGGTAGRIVKQVEEGIGEELARFDGSPHSAGHESLKREQTLRKRNDGGEEIEYDGWEWSKVQGADGWWQIPMKSIYISHNKVFQNQAVILDLNTPYILGPPHAVQTFYSSISGAHQLPPPYNNFYAYPCFNPPVIEFEFGDRGWRGVVLGGPKDKGTWSPGGRFSLGRVEKGSGFCVGVVVAASGGVGNGGNGMEDVWVLGEPFFRDVQVAFDWKEKRVGMQKL